MALVLIRAVAHFTEWVEEYGAAERVLLLALLEAYVAATAKFRSVQSIQGEQSSLELAELAHRLSHLVRLP